MAGWADDALSRAEAAGLREDDLYRLLAGTLITRFPSLDRLLFSLMHQALETDKKTAAVIYYRMNSLGQRLDALRELLKYRLGEPQFAKWKALEKEIRDLAEVRNFVAHQGLASYGGRLTIVENADGTIDARLEEEGGFGTIMGADEQLRGQRGHKFMSSNDLKPEILRLAQVIDGCRLFLDELPKPPR